MIDTTWKLGLSLGTGSTQVAWAPDEAPGGLFSALWVSELALDSIVLSSLGKWRDLSGIEISYLFCWA